MRRRAVPKRRAVQTRRRRLYMHLPCGLQWWSLSNYRYAHALRPVNPHISNNFILRLRALSYLYADCTDGLALGMEDKEISDNRITASTEWDSNHSPQNARLNFPGGGGKAGAWSARRNDRNQWLQVDFELKATVTEILTQGRRDHNQWVTSYTVSYSRDGNHFKPHQVNGKTTVIFFAHYI